MHTLTVDGRLFTAGTLEALVDKMRLESTYGGYPLWAWADDDEDNDVFECAPHWERFDGIISTSDERPTYTVHDVREYAAWLFDAPVDTITISEEYPPQ